MLNQLRLFSPPPSVGGLCCIFSKVFAQIRTLKFSLSKLAPEQLWFWSRWRSLTPFSVSRGSEVEGRARARAPWRPPQEPCLLQGQMLLSVMDLVVSFLFSFPFSLWERGSRHDAQGKDGQSCAGRLFWSQERRGPERPRERGRRSPLAFKSWPHAPNRPQTAPFSVKSGPTSGFRLGTRDPAQSISECTTTSNKVMDTGPELAGARGTPVLEHQCLLPANATNKTSAFSRGLAHGPAAFSPGRALQFLKEGLSKFSVGMTASDTHRRQPDAYTVRENFKQLRSPAPSILGRLYPNVVSAQGLRALQGTSLTLPQHLPCLGSGAGISCWELLPTRLGPFSG